MKAACKAGMMYQRCRVGGRGLGRSAAFVGGSVFRGAAEVLSSGSPCKSALGFSMDQQDRHFSVSDD
jgi:hypothetical protein